MAKKNKYYVVKRGHQVGVFDNWQDCNNATHGYSNACYYGFKTYEEAIEANQLEEEEFRDCYYKIKSSVNLISNNHQSTDEIVLDSICVDASCIGNPGVVEWQGVDTENGSLLFRPKPRPNGTNNIGEFLAIVHGLHYLKEQNKNIPIYSDSQTAISWVKKKKARTKLQNNGDDEIFDIIKRAEKWLQENTYENPILKWDTKSWGEIPADFGRK